MGEAGVRDLTGERAVLCAGKSSASGGGSGQYLPRIKWWPKPPGRGGLRPIERRDRGCPDGKSALGIFVLGLIFSKRDK